MHNQITLEEVEAMITREEQGLPPEPSESGARSLDEDYDVQGLLGRGAFSEVYLGVHRETGEKVALKIFSEDKYMYNPRVQVAIRREVAIMTELARRVRHPCVVRLVGRGVYGDLEGPGGGGPGGGGGRGTALVLEHLSGRELFDRVLARGSYSERDAAVVMHKVAGALQAIHQAGFIHRDIKPENILYETPYEGSELRLTDFGLAMRDAYSPLRGPLGRRAPQVDWCRAASANEAAAAAAGLDLGGLSLIGHTESLVGTRGYVAPECLSDLAYGPACDLWSLGVVLYILLAGYPPFFAASDDELFNSIVAGDYTFEPATWDGISAPGKDIVRRLLTVDPTRRLTARGVLEHPWVRGAVLEPGPFPPAAAHAAAAAARAAPPRPRRRGRRRRRPWHQA